ncbi:glycosyl hydrolase family 8 [Planotetraspora sp. A-T 1434]|uniref:glycosyl hydrolase family 8 n=1 Tax=Planotetraspora sp. A-T 1434 TaxID=2979219 RepID=UPI0021C038F7|nr:glycosyl hydrolase family 8 [Planotetraspora sp. A-T 1434]MCT9929022.1 glycosyl hydrolase family 8 [Planotetraspora sp. A-T 1434]
MRMKSLIVAAGLLLPLAAAHPAAAAATRYEAENATISQGVVESNHLNFSGTGFVNGDNIAGSYTEFSFNAASAGTATLVIRYANGTTSDRPADVAVNGTVVSANRSFPVTANWDTWANSTITAPVNAGSNTLRLTATTAGGNPNLDYVDVDVVAAPPPGTVYQAEDATLSQAGVFNNHLNFTGTGFVDYVNVTGGYVEFNVNAAAAGPASVVVRYANGTTTNRPLEYAVNGSTVATRNYNATANWDTWADDTFTVNLAAGANTIRATATTVNGGPNLDKISVSGSTGGGGDTQAPSVPSGLAVSSTTSSSISLSWSASTDNVGVTGYKVYEGSTVVASPSGTSATISGLAASSSHTYTVSAVDAAGNESAKSASVTGTTTSGGDTQAPSVPTGLAVGTTTSSSISLSWSASTDNVGVTGYKVYEGSTVVASPSGTSATISGLAASSSHTYTVSAVDAAGNESAKSASVTGTTKAASGGPNVPFGSHLFPYAAGTILPTGSQATLDQKVIDYYNKWKAAFLKQNCGNGWYEVISPDADHPYVAEGQGYGMVILATMAGADPNAKTAFDGMVKFMLAHPSVHNANLLAAEQDTSCKSVNGSDSATDGDLDVAYGLLLADKQWGSAGTYNYKDLAVKHINAIKASEVNSTTHLMLLGDWSDSSDSTHYITRSSDWLIDHFRAFKKATGDTAWDTIRTAHQNLITSQQANYAPSTGLLADFIVNTNTTPKPAPGQVLEDPNDGKYFWNACRDPWRIGADAVTSGDSASLASARKLNTWIKSKTGGNPSNVATGYSLSGTAISSGSEPAFFAPFAVAAMTDSGSQAWLDAIWNKMLNTSFTSTDYYSTSIQLQVMIVASGNYWVP